MHELPSYPGAYVKNHDNRYDPATSVYQSLTTPETSSRYRSLEPLKPHQSTRQVYREIINSSNSKGKRLHLVADCALRIRDKAYDWS
ncbi:hypothetical protein TWF225_007873 [Orbilia oligospora]|nr:hypothetical protein TWF751_008042 [Orbilia oligospora]KAF3178569.1 hypothetical protein TWF225_007873 [Orbilia oligospora]